MIKKPVELFRIVEETVALLGAMIPPQITLDIRYGNRSQVLLINETQLRRIIMNLITNAAEAIGDSEGTIRITTGSIEQIPETDTDCRVTTAYGWGFFEIADTGPGVSIENRTRLFDPFFTTKPSGKGLGLAIVQEHVRENEGVIAIGETSDGGARFTVYFPITDMCEEPHDSNDKKKPSGKVNGIVLVIDDEDEVLETTASMLEDAGCTVHTASSGVEGIQCFRDKSDIIGLVLIDLTMPGKDGFTLAREIQAINKAVPIVVSSGYNIPELTNTPPDVTISAYLQKPYQLEVLVDTVSGWIKRV